MSPRTKSAFGYAAAIVIPILFAVAGSRVPAIVREAPAVVFLLVVALTARWCGFGPALLLAFTSTAVVGLTVYRFLSMAPEPMAFRVFLYFTASLVIASISQRGSEDMREAEERFRALVELSPDGIGIAEADATIVFANSALARIVGAADRDQLIGMKTTDFPHREQLATSQQ